MSVKSRLIVFALGCLVSPVFGFAQDGTASAQPAGKLNDYVGMYRPASEPDAVSSIYVDGGKLYAEGERSAPSELKASAADQFQVADTGQRFTFVRDGAGKVTGVKVELRGQERVLEHFSADAKRLSHYRNYVRSEAMIPARDGAKLHVVILRPES